MCSAKTAGAITSSRGLEVGHKALKHVACKLVVTSRWDIVYSKRFSHQARRTKKHTGSGYASHTQMTTTQSDGVLKLDVSIVSSVKCSLQIKKYTAFAAFHSASHANRIHTHHAIVPLRTCGSRRVRQRAKM